MKNLRTYFIICTLASLSGTLFAALDTPTREPISWHTFSKIQLYKLEPYQVIDLSDPIALRDAKNELACIAEDVTRRNHEWTAQSLQIVTDIEKSLAPSEPIFFSTNNPENGEVSHKKTSIEELKKNLRDKITRENQQPFFARHKKIMIKGAVVATGAAAALLIAYKNPALATTIRSCALARCKKLGSSLSNQLAKLAKKTPVTA